MGKVGNGKKHSTDTSGACTAVLPERIPIIIVPLMMEKLTQSLPARKGRMTSMDRGVVRKSYQRATAGGTGQSDWPGELASLFDTLCQAFPLLKLPDLPRDDDS